MPIDQRETTKHSRCFGSLYEPGVRSSLYAHREAELGRLIKDKQVLAFTLGEAGTFIPKWQFRETDQNPEIHPDVDEAWSRWGKDIAPLAFAVHLTAPFLDSDRSRLDVLLEQTDEHAMEEAKRDPTTPT